MILFINTTLNNEIELALKKDGKILACQNFSAPHQQSEKLLPGIDKLLKKNKIKLSDLTGIEVENRGGSFTSLRIGVVTANALGFALKIPVCPKITNYKLQITNKNQKSKIKNQKFSIVEPAYDREPNITLKKQLTFDN